MLILFLELKEKKAELCGVFFPNMQIFMRTCLTFLSSFEKFPKGNYKLSYRIKFQARLTSSSSTSSSFGLLWDFSDSVEVMIVDSTAIVSLIFA